MTVILGVPGANGTENSLKVCNAMIGQGERPEDMAAGFLKGEGVEVTLLRYRLPLSRLPNRARPEVDPLGRFAG